MQEPASPPISSLSLATRLAIALLLGIQLGLTALFNLNASSQKWLNLLPIVVLLSALVLSILLSPQAREASISSRRTLNLLGRMFMVMLLPPLALAIICLILPFFLALVALAIPMEMAMIAAFVVGSETVPLAIGTALATWIGTSIFLLIGGITSNHQPDGHLLLEILILAILFGLGLAIPGGLLGRRLRVWVFQDYPGSML